MAADVGSHTSEELTVNDKRERPSMAHTTSSPPGRLAVVRIAGLPGDASARDFVGAAHGTLPVSLIVITTSPETAQTYTSTTTTKSSSSSRAR